VRRFDAIVVGAGPAGSTTAYRLASAGATVCLLDRARFPRDKPCGGGLTLRAVRQLPFSVAPVVEDTVDRFELGFRYGTRRMRSGGGPLILMTQRRRLDAYLAERAEAAGAQFRDGAKVTAVDADGTVRLEGERLRADVVVGADGANGVTARSLGLRPHDHAVALEGNIAHRYAPRERFAGCAIVELGVVPGGYAWIFPKGDHVNVGVGGWEREAPSLRQRLRELCSAFGLDDAPVTGLRGHRLPMRRPGATSLAGRALLVGDAAGLVDPLTGDGMFEAFVSGRLATAVTLDVLAGRRSSVEPYHELLEDALAGSLAVAGRARSALERFPRFVFEVVNLSPVWRLLVSVLRGELADPAAATGVASAPLRLVIALGVAPERTSPELAR
jgi:geranylgeranyl reductase family protein